VTTFVLLPFAKQLEKIANRLIPEKEEEKDVLFDERLLTMPAFAVAKAEDVAKARELLQLKDIFRYMDDYALTSGEYNTLRKAAAELILKLK
jgi:Na+/phosphate symporter